MGKPSNWSILLLGVQLEFVFLSVHVHARTQQYVQHANTHRRRDPFNSEF
jgi:hypothetical protein